MTEVKPKFYTAKYDRVFRKIFVNAKDYKLLEAVLSACLDKDVKIIKFIDTELNVRNVKERVKRLISLSNLLESKYLDSFIGKTVEVLIETSDTFESIGHTDNYLKVIINNSLPSNELVKVKITERLGTSLKGILEK